MAEQLERSELFSVSMWSAAVAPDVTWIPALVADIDALLDAGDLDFEICSGHQTRPELQYRTEPHWQQFHAFVTETFEAIASTAPQTRWPRHGLRSWGLRINEESVEKDLRRGPTRTLLTHNHSPALLTSVFTCELPATPEPEKLATAFYNPASHMVCPWQERISLVAPAVGLLTVFPGWIEHAAPLLVPLPPGGRRIIISTDYFPELEPG